jgi:2-polyprenyl-6-hydroxyphenyl methylase/3-demethylubiquinone-9 3-methyltransferase
MNERAANVDAAELARFDALAERWWDPHGPLSTLHAINPLRMEYIRARTRLAGARVLDVGCGGGLLSEALAREGASVDGIDLAEASLEAARQHAASEGLAIDYRCVDAASHADAHPGTYDVVTCMELLEHVPDPEALVAAISRAVKPGGSVFFSTINRTARSFALAIVAAEHLLQLVPRGTHQYAKLIRPSELAAWCRASGLALRDTTGMQFNPITGTHRLGGSNRVNYLCHARRHDLP